MKRLLLFAALSLVPSLAARAEHAEAPPGGTAGEKDAHSGDGGHHEYHLDTKSWIRFLVVQGLGFALLLALLFKLVIPVLRKALDERAERIRVTYEKLEKEKAELDRMTAEAERRLAGIEAEAKAKSEAAVREGAAQKAALVAEAEASAFRILAKAKTEIEMEHAKAIEEIRLTLSRLAMDAAERIVREQLTPQKQEELIERFISDIDRVKA
jgi:F-type H+-transporting ATPase subunit b